MIKKILYLLSILSCLAILFVIVAPQLPKTRNLIYYSNCFEVKKYKIGNIDDRFGISQTDLFKHLQKASSVWNTAYGKTLLTYDESANLTINLVYDKRQELNSKIDELDNDLKRKKSEIDPKLNDYNSRSESFSKKLEEFNNEVRKWNSEGGAPQDVYDRLIKEQESLKTEAGELNQMAHELGQTTNQYNESVDLLNRTVNNFGQVISGKPEEGLYEQNGKEETITIYLHNSEQELIHTLTHEFGHALLMSHVTDPNAIMYARTNETIVPTDDDVKELSKVCKERLITNVIIEHYKNVFNYLRSGKKVRL